MTQTKYPATIIVHTSHGPVAACQTHAAMVAGLLRVLGASAQQTVAPEGSECENCKNEAALENKP